MTHLTYYVTFSGDRHVYRGLRKTQAIWRYHWLNRNSRKLDLREWGWKEIN
jgi:hypothetical protein